MRENGSAHTFVDNHNKGKERSLCVADPHPAAVQVSHT